jgi:tight adherence protein C
MGKTRRQAMEDMARRIDFLDLNTFVSILNQANELGTPLGQILRVQSSTMRTKRFQRAEEFAQKAPVKILAPLMVCIFPTVFIILLGPLLLRFIGGGF